MDYVGSSTVGRRVLVARCDLGDLTSALVVAYNSRKDEHCLRFADGELIWRKLRVGEVSLATSVHPPTPAHPVRATTPASTQCSTEPSLSTQPSVTLGGGSVSTVRAGVLVEAHDNQTLETPAAVRMSAAKGDSLQTTSGRPPVQERVVALKLFKTSQEMHSRSHLTAGNSFCLYPEVAVHEASVMQLVAPHSHVAEFLGTFRHRAPLPQSPSQAGAPANVPLADDAVNPLESMKKRPAPKVVQHVDTVSGAESSKGLQNEEQGPSDVNNGHRSSDHTSESSSSVSAPASTGALSAGSTADGGDVGSTTGSSRKARASSSNVSTGGKSGNSGGSSSSSSGKEQTQVDTSSGPRRSKRNKCGVLDNDDLGVQKENEDEVLPNAANSISSTISSNSQPTVQQTAGARSAAPQTSHSSRLSQSAMQLPPHVVVASGSGLSLHTSLRSAFPSATTSDQNVVGAEAETTVSATPANKRRRGGTSSASSTASNSSASSAGRSRSSPPPHTPRLARSAAASSAAAAVSVSDQRAGVGAVPPFSAEARTTTSSTAPTTASLPPPPPWGDLELSERPLVGGPRPLPAHLEDELQHSSLGVCVALAESDLDCVLTGTAGYGLSPQWEPDVVSAATPMMSAGEEVPPSGTNSSITAAGGVSINGRNATSRSAQCAPQHSAQYVQKVANLTSKHRKQTMPLPRAEPDATAAWKWRRPLPPQRAQRLFWQLLRGLEGCHSRGVVHRNVKPAQLLVGRQKRQRYVPKPKPPLQQPLSSGIDSSGSSGDAMCGKSGDDDDDDDEEVLQLCGFSHSIVLARGGASEPVERTDAGTLWYRPPESLLGVRQVTCAADLWAAGAVWVEVLTGQPLFSSCTTEYGTLLDIFQLQGLPPLDCPLRKAPLFDAAVFPHWPRAKCPAEGSGVAGLLGPLGCALLRGLLAYDPAQRLTARQALAHPYWRCFDPRPPAGGVLAPHFQLPTSHSNLQARGACAAFQAAVKAATDASRHFTTREQARASAVALSAMAQNLAASCATEGSTAQEGATVVGAVWQHAAVVEDAIRELAGAERARQLKAASDNSDDGPYTVPMEGGAAQLGVGSVVLERSRLARSLKTLLLAKPAPAASSECPREFAVRALQRFCALAAMPDLPPLPSAAESTTLKSASGGAPAAAPAAAPSLDALTDLDPSVSDLAPLSDPEPQSPMSPPSLARIRTAAGASALLSSCSSSSSSSSSSSHACSFPSTEFPLESTPPPAAAAANLPKRSDGLYPNGPEADIAFAVEAPPDYDRHNDYLNTDDTTYFAKPLLPSTPSPKIHIPNSKSAARVEYVKAHRSVLLEVPSLVLATNMTHDTRDTTQGQTVKVLGCRPDSFRALLHFLYFGALPTTIAAKSNLEKATNTNKAPSAPIHAHSSKDSSNSSSGSITSTNVPAEPLPSSLIPSGACAAGLVELAERFMVPSLHAPAAQALRASLEALAPLSSSMTLSSSSSSLTSSMKPMMTSSSPRPTAPSCDDDAAAVQKATLARNQLWRVLECATDLQFNEPAQAALLKVAGQWLAPRLQDPVLALMEDPRTVDNYEAVVGLVVDQTLRLLADRGVGFYDLCVLFPDENGDENRGFGDEDDVTAKPALQNAAAASLGWTTPPRATSLLAVQLPLPQPCGLLEDDVARLGRTAQWGSFENSNGSSSSSNGSSSSFSSSSGSSSSSSGNRTSSGSSSSSSSSDACVHQAGVPCPWGGRGVGRSVGRADGAAMAVYMWRARAASRQAQPPAHFLERLGGRARHRSSGHHEAMERDAARAARSAANAHAALSLFASPPRRTTRAAGGAHSASSASSNGQRAAAGGAGSAGGAYPRAPIPRLPPPSAGLLTPPQPPPDFAFAPTASQRVILLDWHTEVAEEYHISSEGLHLAARLLDRALVALPHVSRNTFQLLGCACMLVAAKLTENDPIDLNDFVYICDNTYTLQQFMVAELQVMACLKCDVAVITPFTLLGPLMDAAESHPIEQQLAEFLLELSLLDPLMSTSAVDPPTLAAACLFLSRLTLLHAQRRRQSAARAVAARQAETGGGTRGGGPFQRQAPTGRSAAHRPLGTSVTSSVSTSSSSSSSGHRGGVGLANGGSEFEWGGIFDVLGPTTTSTSMGGEPNGYGGNDGSSSGDGSNAVAFVGAGQHMNAEDTDESDCEAPSESEDGDEDDCLKGSGGGRSSARATRKTQQQQQDEWPPSFRELEQQHEQQQRRRPANRPPELGRFAARAVDSYEAKLTVFGADEFVAAVQAAREGLGGHNNTSNEAADCDAGALDHGGDTIGSPTRSTNNYNSSGSGGPWASPKATGYDTPPCSPPPVLSPLARPRSGGPTSASNATPLLPTASGGGGGCTNSSSFSSSSSSSSSSSTAAASGSRPVHWLDLVWPPHLAALSDRSVASLCALAVPRLHECHRAALRLCRGLYPHASAAAPVDCFGAPSSEPKGPHSHHYGGGYGAVPSSSSGADTPSVQAAPAKSARRKTTRQGTYTSADSSSVDGNPNASPSDSSPSTPGTTTSVPWRDRNWWLPPASATAPQKPLACVRKFERPKPHLEAATVAPLGPRRLRAHLATLLAREQLSCDTATPSFEPSSSNSHGRHDSLLSKPSTSNNNGNAAAAAAAEADEHRRGIWQDGASGFHSTNKRSGPPQLSPHAQKIHRRDSD